MYIIRSGNGFVFNSATGKMIGWCGEDKLNQDACALKAERMTVDEAKILAKKMNDSGLETEIVQLKIGDAPMPNDLHQCPWCPDGGDIKVLGEALFGHPAKRANCMTCGVAGPYGQTDDEALGYFQQAFNTLHHLDETNNGE